MDFPSLLQSSENERRLQLADTPPESERILRCAPLFDAQSEHEKDLEYESRVDAESWQYDGPAEREGPMSEPVTGATEQEAIADLKAQVEK